MKRAEYRHFFDAFSTLSRAQGATGTANADTQREKLKKYFVDFSRRSHALTVAHSADADTQRKTLEEYFSAFPLAFERWRRLGENFNLWYLAFRKPRETECTRILAWFLDATAQHGQRNAFFAAFLELLEDKDWSARQKPPVPEHYSVETEVTSDDGKSRMDLVITGNDFMLIVEVKLYTSEHGRQMQRYKKLANKSGRENTAMIYLTVSGEPSQDLPEAKALSWKAVSMNMQKALYGLDALPAHAPVRLACRDFCRYINTI